MTRFRSRQTTRCDGIDRREALRVGGLSAFGLGLASWMDLRSLQAAQPTSPAATAKACILVWLDGGPSHLETFDPKPDATSEIRGPLGSIPTRVAGVRLNECFVEMAKRMDQFALVRSMTSPLGEHNFGTHYLQTGFRPTPALEYPSFQAVGASRYRKPTPLPPSIAIPNARMGGGTFRSHGFLPSSAAPFSVGSDPSRPGFGVRDLDLYRGLTLDRIERRQRFVRRLEQFSGIADGPGDAGFEQAFRLVTSPEARQAFSIDEEPDAVRDRYGRRTAGQSCLLARRLVERGVPFVTVNVPGWDTHADLVTRIRDGYAGAREPVGLAPSLDRALGALVDDLRDRSLLDETLIVVMGEFGRTPKLNGSGGRDHWPRVFSVALAGGGVPGGQVVGASDALGESPLDRAVTPSDLVATLYRLLGIDPSLELTTPDGRPIRITPSESAVIEELLP